MVFITFEMIEFTFVCLYDGTSYRLCLYGCPSAIRPIWTLCNVDKQTEFSFSRLQESRLGSVIVALAQRRTYCAISGDMNWYARSEGAMIFNLLHLNFILGNYLLPTSIDY